MIQNEFHFQWDVHITTIITTTKNKTEKGSQSQVSPDSFLGSLLVVTYGWLVAGKSKNIYGMFMSQDRTSSLDMNEQWWRMARQKYHGGIYHVLRTLANPKENIMFVIKLPPSLFLNHHLNHTHITGTLLLPSLRLQKLWLRHNLRHDMGIPPLPHRLCVHRPLWSVRGTHVRFLRTQGGNAGICIPLQFGSIEYQE